MNGVTLTLLILGSTLPMSALGLAAGLLVERITGAPRLRERVWSLSLLAPVLAVVAVVLISPHLSRPAPPAASVAAVADQATTGVVVTTPTTFDPLQTVGDLAVLLGPVLLLSVILLGMVVAVALLVRGHVLLGQLLATAKPLDDSALSADLDRQAAALKVKSPSLKASDRAGSPLLAGLIHPAIVIPKALTALPTPRLALICGHELAHLKRGDNPRAWAEGLLLAVMWFNPFMGMIHARLNAAREEHCDAIALAQADTAARRAYAETLIETLRLSAGPEPQSAFIGAGRKTAMRLKAILKPHAPAGLGAHAAVLGIASILALGVGGSAVALAMQAAPAKAVAGRSSSWKQSVQDNAFAPKGMIDIAADQVRLKGDVAYWSGRPAIYLTPATGDARKDAELANVRFLINGQPTSADFNPNQLDGDRIGLIKVHKPKGSEAPTVIDIVMAPEAPPAPPAPPAPAPEPPPAPPTPPEVPSPVTPMTAPTPPAPPTPPTPVARLAPLAPIPSAARMAPLPPPAPPAPPAAAPAPPAPPHPPIIGKPEWIARPTAADVAAVYPANARERAGRVGLSCSTLGDGRLVDCKAKGAKPADVPFEAAALKLAAKYRLSGKLPDGRPAGGGFVYIPMSFQPAGS